jgi:hypothetical protein
MNHSNCRARLVALTRDLHVRWQETREHWSDAKRDEFERRFLTELFSSVEKASSALEQLDEVVTKARTDCE